MLHRPLGTTGMRVSILGMGGSGFGGVYGKYDEKEAIKTVEVAIANGVNYFDTAYWYGQGKSEMFLGKALKGVPRDRFFVGTKVGRYERDIPNMFNFSAAKVTKSAEESLKRLQLDHVDILQIHDVEFAPSVDIIVNETLPALEKLKQRGLCKFIGITGYPLGPLREIIQRSTVKIDSVLTYCRLSLNDSSLTDSFDFFKSNGVPLINASPVSMGLLTHVPVQPWHPASEEVRQACARAVDYCDSQGVDITRIAVNYAVGFEEVMIGIMHPCCFTFMLSVLFGFCTPYFLSYCT